MCLLRISPGKWTYWSVSREESRNWKNNWKKKLIRWGYIWFVAVWTVRPAILQRQTTGNRSGLLAEKGNLKLIQRDWYCDVFFVYSFLFWFILVGIKRKQGCVKIWWYKKRFANKKIWLKKTAKLQNYAKLKQSKPLNSSTILMK